MNNIFFHCLFFCFISINICAAEPEHNSLVQVKAEKNKLVSEIFENESSLTKYECAIQIQKAIYNLVTREPINDPEETRMAMMIDCLSGHDALQQCDEIAISETTEENRNCISIKKSSLINENKKLSYQDLAENFTDNSDNIIRFVSDIITVDPDKLSEIINKKTE